MQHICSGEVHRPCCEFFSPFAAVSALGLSCLAALLDVFQREDVGACLAGLDDGAGPVLGLVSATLFSDVTIPALNAVSASVLLLSHFACSSLEENKVVHAITAS